MDVDQQSPVNQESAVRIAPHSNASNSSSIRVWYRLLENGIFNGNVSRIVMSSTSDIWDLLVKLNLSDPTHVNVYAPNEDLTIKKQVDLRSLGLSPVNNQSTLNEVLRYRDADVKKQNPYPLIVELPIIDVDAARNASQTFPFQRSKIDNNFMIQENLDLSKTSGLCKFVIYLFDKLVSNRNLTENLQFEDNCLEFRLDHRMTSYVLDTESNIKILIGPSGAGKTRTLLELLYSTFGYYFTVKSSVKDFGSKDLSDCLVICDRDPGNTKFYISVLYFVRASICNYLKNNLGFDEPWKILVAQLHPNKVFGTDIFATLFDRVCDNIRSAPPLQDCFHFVAIDEIQCSLEGPMSHSLPGSVNKRPFFSPLVYYSKHFEKFPQFVLAGTGINFTFIKESLESSSLKDDLITGYNVLSQFCPLTKDQVVNYARFILQEHYLDQMTVAEVVSQIADFDLCHGRARFVAFILNRYLLSLNIEETFSDFITAITNIHGDIFPLRFLQRDLIYNGQGLCRVVGHSTFYDIISNGVIDFIISGSAKLNVSNDDAAKAIQYGLGFGHVNDMNVISRVELCELALMESFRYVIPFGDLVKRFLIRMTSCPKPQMVGYLLEYLVAFAVVVNELGLEKSRNMKAYQLGILDYLDTNTESDVFFPSPMCGPDAIRICSETKTVKLFQIKFDNNMTKQKRVKAYNTTNPALFYCNRTTGKVLRGFEDKPGKAGLRSRVLDMLAKLERDGYTIKRYAFFHSTKMHMTEEACVEVISKETCPHYFDRLGEGAGIWAFLDYLRSDFQ